MHSAPPDPVGTTVHVPTFVYFSMERQGAERAGPITVRDALTVMSTAVSGLYFKVTLRSRLPRLEVCRVIRKLSHEDLGYWFYSFFNQVPKALLKAVEGTQIKTSQSFAGISANRKETADTCRHRCLQPGTPSST